MNKRERILVGCVGTAVLGFVAYMGVSKLFLDPAQARFAKATELREKIRKAEDEKKKENQFKARYVEVAGETFGIDELKVSEELRKRITDMVIASKLLPSNLTLKPVIGSRVPGVYKSIGWMIRVRGKEPALTNFLYLLKSEAHIHRLDNVVLSPVPNSVELELQAMYATLVLEQPADDKTIKLVTTGKGSAPGAIAVDVVPEVPPAELLKGKNRDSYDIIASRNLFLPYIKAAPPQLARTSSDPVSTPENPGSGGGPKVAKSQYKLVGLPAISGMPAIAVSDSATGKTAWYKPGNPLAGGRIVMVDYRPMPKPNNPLLQSQSRVVIQVGYEYQAIELGGYLTEKHKIAPDQLPPELPKLELPAPPAPKAATTSEPKVEAKPEVKVEAKSDSKPDAKADAKS